MMWPIGVCAEHQVTACPECYRETSRASLLSVICRQLADLAIRGYRRVLVELFTGWRLHRARNSSLSVDRTRKCSPYASGGFIGGPLHSDEDLIPAFLSPGYVLTGQMAADFRELLGKAVIDAGSGLMVLPPGGFSVASTPRSASSTTAPRASGSASKGEGSMAANHGDGHLSPAGYCMCGCAECVGDGKSCPCRACRCATVEKAAQDFTKPIYAGRNAGSANYPGNAVPDPAQDAVFGPDDSNIVRGDCD